ncbi:hypothetical protein GGP41_005852 [Bipolaris sorokiniana]|uniref:Uncharacterized protein n=1 Tax=Cochliobolus sativus TaxID=45130 RepID=A0A8H5ZHT1_COCSA|nr:hypothetical protein GGP41_005852 [Bipolaris sorokiniana]
MMTKRPLRIPPVLHLRPTKTAPSIVVEEDFSVKNSHASRRRSSDPSDGTPLTHCFQIPEIRRISEATDGSQS